MPRHSPAIAALVIGALAAPALADETEGEILAYDRLANLVVMRDRTVWQLGTGTLVPADLQSGDRVRIVYETAGEDGVTEIGSIERLGG